MHSSGASGRAGSYGSQYAVYSKPDDSHPNNETSHYRNPYTNSFHQFYLQSPELQPQFRIEISHPKLGNYAQVQYDQSVQWDHTYSL